MLTPRRVCSSYKKASTSREVAKILSRGLYSRRSHRQGRVFVRHIAQAKRHGQVARTACDVKDRITLLTVTNQGKTRWMIIDDAFDADKLIEFLAASIKDAGKKVFLILDNLRVHHSKVVKAYFQDHRVRYAA